MIYRYQFELKWDTFFRWALSLSCPMRNNLEQMTIGKTQTALHFFIILIIFSAIITTRFHQSAGEARNVRISEKYSWLS